MAKEPEVSLPSESVHNEEWNHGEKYAFIALARVYSGTLRSDLAGSLNDALWFRTAMNQDVITEPLARPFARSLVPFTTELVGKSQSPAALNYSAMVVALVESRSTDGGESIFFRHTSRRKGQRIFVLGPKHDPMAALDAVQAGKMGKTVDEFDADVKDGGLCSFRCKFSPTI